MPRGTLGCTNPFDKSLRLGSQSLFIDFNNKNNENFLYKPALIQLEQQKDALSDVPIKQSQQAAAPIQGHQSHFIHKKQSQCNIRRISGVSYVKKTESKQASVRDRY